MTEVRIVVNTPVNNGPDDPPNIKHVKAKAVAYDLSKDPRTGARVLGTDEISEDFDAFVGDVLEDMDTLGYNLTMAHAWQIKKRDSMLTGEDLRTDETKRTERSELFMKLLLEFGDKPVELLGNMLAAFMVGTVESSLDDDEIDQMLEDWERNAAASALNEAASPNGSE